MSEFPNINRRNALFTTEGGERVNLSSLHQSFAPWERAAWYQQSLIFAWDDYGTLPDGVEAFLVELNRWASRLQIE